MLYMVSQVDFLVLASKISKTYKLLTRVQVGTSVWDWYGLVVRFGGVKHKSDVTVLPPNRRPM